jgi:hypothetical protein
MHDGPSFSILRCKLLPVQRRRVVAFWKELVNCIDFNVVLTSAGEFCDVDTSLEICLSISSFATELVFLRVGETPAGRPASASLPDVSSLSHSDCVLRTDGQHDKHGKRLGMVLLIKAYGLYEWDF